MSERIERCENCRWWLSHRSILEDEAEPEEGDAGECHRNAPIAHVEPEEGESGNRMSVWPLTEIDDFCGEFAPKPTEPIE